MYYICVGEELVENKGLVTGDVSAGVVGNADQHFMSLRSNYIVG